MREETQDRKAAWYLDDGTIVGDTHIVAKALDIIKIDGSARGLFYNVDKTKLFWPVEDPRSRVKGVFPINISRSLNGVKLLVAVTTLPINLDGLGILSARDIIQYAFIASCMQMSDLQSKILLNTGIVSYGSSFMHAFDAFNC
uniref:Uncharacterized protein n=1 Tax=Tanacetum cinerariifolium TaxID=118510 RepID=A0A6L2LNA6_TANCI|nr:hypothetical protein [Tanacetum cinerariifolium]